MSDIVYSATPPMVKNHPFGFVILLLLIPMTFGLSFLLILSWYLRCKAQKLVLTSDELLWEEGLLSKKRTELQLSKVRTTKVSQRLGQRIFGTGDIEVFTAGDNPEITVKGMPEPEKLRGIIKQGTAA